VKGILGVVLEREVGYFIVDFHSFPFWSSGARTSQSPVSWFLTASQETGGVVVLCGIATSLRHH
jgi:hypothetical protein